LFGFAEPQFVSKDHEQQCTLGDLSERSAEVERGPRRERDQVDPLADTRLWIAVEVAGFARQQAQA